MAYYDHDYYTEPVVPTCEQCDHDLPDRPVATWIQEEPVASDGDGNLLIGYVEYYRYTCTKCGEDTVLNNL